MNVSRALRPAIAFALCSVAFAATAQVGTDLDLRGVPQGRRLLERYLGPDSVVGSHSGTVFAYATSAWASEAERAAAAADRALPAIAWEIGVRPKALAPIWILVSPGGGTLAREAPSWSAAIAKPEQHLVVLSGPALRAGRAGLEPTVVHEVAHLALHARLGAAGWAPRWFDEGLAMHVAGALGWRDRAAALGRGPVHLRELTDTFPRDARRAGFAYVESEAAVRRLLKRGSLAPLLDRVAAGHDFDAAFAVVYGETTREFADRVHAEVAGRWRWVAALGGGVSLGGLMAALAVVGAVRTARRNRRRMREWEAAEHGDAPLSDLDPSADSTPDR